MGCALTTEQYIPVVENLIRLNPGVYTNYDNAARFILTASLTEEQKKISSSQYGPYLQWAFWFKSREV